MWAERKKLFHFEVVIHKNIQIHWYTGFSKINKDNGRQL